MNEALQHWSDFFVAVSGAAAALTGLVFVGVSINIQRILKSPHMTSLALESLVAFSSVVLVAIFGLVPGQPLWVLGAEIGWVGLALSGVLGVRHIRKFKNLRSWAIFNQVPPLCMVIAAVMLVRGNTVGLYGLVPGVILSFFSGLVGAWVLLVEILRHEKDAVDEVTP